MQTVLVGVDVEKHEPEPLCWAAEYARLITAELVGVVAYQPAQAEVPPSFYDEDVAEVQKQAAKLIDAVAPAVPHRIDFRHGSARDAIPDAARDDGAAAVVVGVHGTGGFHHLGVGTTAHYLARHLSVPLVSIPSSQPSSRGRAVVVGLDGSAGDVSTLAWAVQFAHAAGGPVVAVYASDPMAMTYPHPRGATIADKAEEVVRAQVARVAGHGVDVTILVEVDDPVPTLVRSANESDASVIVVGRKGAAHQRGMVLGRVLSELPFDAHRAVAIVPRASAA